MLYYTYRGHIMRIKTYTRNNYTFKEHSGNFQKIKYDAKKEDYFLTFNKQRFYFNDCINLSQASVNQILETLADQTSDPKTITFAATPYSYITEEQKTAATAKGWTINQA